MVDLAALSDEQRRAVLAPDDGPLLIDARPGSGKTAVLTHRVAWLVAGRGLEPWELLPIAFTNRAVDEMRSRLAGLLGRRAGLIPVTTFHAFGRRLIADFELASGEVDFDQMLAIPVWALRRGHPMRVFLRRAIRHVLIDEAQDVTPMQAELVDHLAGVQGCVTAVGDSDQAIYRTLSGALGVDWFAARYPAATILRLDDNHRSAAGVVRLTNALMDRAARPRRPAGPPPVLYVARDEWDEADFIAREVVRLYLAGAIRAANEAAVLVRLKAQAPVIAWALARRRVPRDMRINEIEDERRPGRGVVVATIHSSKGGEWPVVFVPGLTEGTLPVRWSVSPWAARREAAAIEEQLAEEHRLLYVAVSRAVDRLYCSYPATRRQGALTVLTRPSRFLARFPPGGGVVRTFREQG